MRIFTISDLHIDYKENRSWVENLSYQDYTDDILICAGDISAHTDRVVWAFDQLKPRFKEVLFVPGNHDLWVTSQNNNNSLKKFHLLNKIAELSGINTTGYISEDVAILPLLAWFDYSFGVPEESMKKIWQDYRYCKWPNSLSNKDMCREFLAMNSHEVYKDRLVITFSHFMPRIDIMPGYIPPERRNIYPYLGTESLDSIIDELNSDIHVYGHSHFNRDIIAGSRRYVNNAFGYPRETRITNKELLCIYEVNTVRC